MAQEAELNVKSDSVKQLTTAVDALVKSLEALAGKATKAEKNTEKVGTTAKKTGKSAKDAVKDTDKFQDSLKDMANSASLVTGPLGGIASRISTIGRVAKTGQLAMVALSVAATLITKGLMSTGDAADRANILLGNLNAQVRASGEAAGFTGKELDEFARSLAFATLDSHEGVVKLTQAMLTFRSVTGNTFKTAIGLSQDLGIAMSQDPITAAKTLGKVLQNPLANFKQLKRAGIEFSDQQVSDLKTLQVKNDLLGQQKIITDQIAESVGGLAREQADSLAGDRDTLSQKYDLLAESIGKKVLPVMRTAVELAIDLVDTLQAIGETDAETALRKITEAGTIANASIQDLNELHDETSDELLRQMDRVASLNALWKDNIWLTTKQKDGIVEQVVIAEKAADVAVEKLEEIIAAQDKIANPKTPKVADPEGFKEKLAALDAQIVSQTKLNTLFKKTGDTRTESFRHAQVEAKVRAEAAKLSISESSEEYKWLLRKRKIVSDLTEARIKDNTVVQIRKGLENETRGLKTRVELQRLLNAGNTKSSAIYQERLAILSAQDKLIKANISLTSEEGKAIIDLAKDTGKYKQTLEDIAALKNIGLTAANGYRIASSEIIEIKLELLESIKAINASEILNEQQKVAAIAEIKRVASEDTSAVLGVNVEVDKEGGIESVISEIQANETAKNLALQELRMAFQGTDLEQHEEYLRRKNEITQEYEQNASEITQKNFDNSNAHKQRMRQVDVANEISAGLQTLSAVAGNNKKLAKMAKAASIFSASVSLVDALSNAAAEKFPLNIALYAKAFSQGTQLISMASGLNEPSFAFGGVDIQGRGTGRSDDIHARIARGESVMTAAATSNHKDVLRRMNAGLPVTGSVGGSSNSTSYSPSIVIQGDASSKTITAIDERLTQFEGRVMEIARGASLEVISEEQMVGGVFDPI